MHELSIARNLVVLAEETARSANADRVVAVRIRVGALSGVAAEALVFGYDVATEGTLLQGSSLEIERVPVAIFCESCAEERELEGIRSFRCPVCDAPSGRLVRGKELEMVSLEVEP